MDCCLPSTNIPSALVGSFFNPQLNLIAAYIHAKIIICKYDHLMKCIQQPVTCSKQPLQLKHIQFNSMHNILIHVRNLQLSLRSIFWIWQGTKKYSYIWVFFIIFVNNSPKRGFQINELAQKTSRVDLRICPAIYVTYF